MILQVESVVKLKYFELIRDPPHDGRELVLV